MTTDRVTALHNGDLSEEDRLNLLDETLEQLLALGAIELEDECEPVPQPRFRPAVARSAA